MGTQKPSYRVGRTFSHRNSSLDTHLSVNMSIEGLTYKVAKQQNSGWKNWLLATAIFPACIEETLTVLDNISFSVKSGQMMAILGGSGSGKTSLLDVILCRNKSGYITGKVMMNGEERTPELIEACASYVRQEDNLMPSLTVQETLMFVAQLKLPKMFSSTEIKARVEEVIKELSLSHVAHTKVGGAEIRGISGGERRRVSIGIQLLIDPSVLILDEPTSGLDSHTAIQIVSTLGRLAGNRRTVLMTIHQPRSTIFRLFDLALLISRGRIVYFGKSSEMVDYFSKLGYSCPEHTNPCDFYVDLTSIDPTSLETEEASQSIVNYFQDEYYHYAKLSKRPEPTGPNGRQMSSLHGAIFPQDAYPGLCMQFFVLFKRLMFAGVENYHLLIVQSAQAFALSIILGVLYFRLEKTQETLRDHFGVLFMICLTYSSVIIFDTIHKCHADRKLLYFETQDHLYSLHVYYTAKVASDLVFQSVYTLIYVIPFYFLVSMPYDPSIFFQVYFIVLLNVLCCHGLAISSAAVFPSFQVSSYFSQVIFITNFMAGGFFINLDNILSQLQWMSVISFFRWSFQGLCLILIKPMSFSCEGEAIPGTCVRDGDAALKMYALDEGSTLIMLAVFGGTFAVLMILLFVGIMFIPQIPEEH